MDRRPVGVFDSGVGGLTVFKELEASLPHESLVYLGDTARVPYGVRSAATVVRYSIEAAHFFRGHDVKMVVVACNTASSVALCDLSREAGVPVLGVIEPGARQAVEQTRSGKIGVIGTRATVGSAAYTRAIQSLNPDIEVIGAACPLFVPLAEEGWTDNNVAVETARLYLEPMRKAGVDTLVLGCTHYPLLKNVIAAVMGDGVHLVDSAQAVSVEVRDHLTTSSKLLASEQDAVPRHQFYVTDAPESFHTVARRFLGRSLDHLEAVAIAGE